jgi:tetratricopeptide (TPR) repeat protein
LAWIKNGGPCIPVIIAAVFLAYFPTLSNGFVLWDDDVNFLENINYRGLSPAHLTWMFTTFHMGPYQPLSWVSLGLDYVVWGMNPRGYHLTSLILHALNAVLLFVLAGALLRRLCPHNARPGMIRLAAAAGALFFALHPLRVESVAWATERRDVLSGVFYLLTVICYLRRDEAASDFGRRAWYMACLLSFVAGLFSKASGATLPLVLLLLDFYPLRRIPSPDEDSHLDVERLPALARDAREQAGRTWKLGRSTLSMGRSLFFLIFEKFPFLFLSFNFGILAIHGQRTEAAMLAMEEHGLVARLMQSAYGLYFYVEKTLVPFRLSPMYLREHAGSSLDDRHIMAAAAVFILTLSLLVSRRQRGVLTAWLCYVVLVLPVAGVAQAGMQVAADRYTYLPTMPFAVLVAALLSMPAILERRRTEREGIPLEARVPRFGGVPLVRAVLLTLITAALTTLGALANRQTRIWHDTLSLWSHALTIDPANYLAYNNRGNHYEKLGETEAAFADYDAAIQIRPEYALSYSNRGNLRHRSGDLVGALADHDRGIALQKSPIPKTYNNRANVHQMLGNTQQALADYATAIRLKPDLWEAYINRAKILIGLGDFAGVVRDYDMAINLRSGHFGSWLDRGFALMRMGRNTEALTNFDAAVRLNPKIPITYLNRGIVRRRLGDDTGAVRDFTQALKLAPPDWSFRPEVEQYLREMQGL